MDSALRRATSALRREFSPLRDEFSSASVVTVVSRRWSRLTLVCGHNAGGALADRSTASAVALSSLSLRVRVTRAAGRSLLPL